MTTKLKDKYGVVGLPTVIMLDKNGKEVARFNEKVEPEKFYTTMRCSVPVATGPTAVGMK